VVAATSVLAALWLSGCRRPPRLGAPPPPSGGRFDVAAQLGGGEELRALREIPLAVTVTEGGKPVAGAEVTAKLTMPAMKMPENKVRLQFAAGAGAYRGAVTFTMPGLWQVEVSVRSADGSVERHAFRYQVSGR